MIEKKCLQSSAKSGYRFCSFQFSRQLVRCWFQQHITDFSFNSLITVPNHIFVFWQSDCKVLWKRKEKIAMIQPRNGYNQYCFALYSRFFEDKLTRLRPAASFLTQIFHNVLYIRVGKLIVHLWRSQHSQTVVWGGSRWDGSWKTHVGTGATPTAAADIQSSLLFQ